LAAAKNKQMRLNLADSVLQKRLYRRKEQTAAFDIPRSGLLGQIFFSAVSAVRRPLITVVSYIGRSRKFCSSWIIRFSFPNRRRALAGHFAQPAFGILSDIGRGLRFSIRESPAFLLVFQQNALRKFRSPPENNRAAGIAKSV